LTADVLLDDIVELSTRRYLVTEVLNIWQVSMGGSHKPLIMNPGMLSSPGDLDGLSRFMALMTSELETDAKGKTSEDGKRAGRTKGLELLYTD
jgi:hypothetical protein